ncbi:hypothetical protein [Pseudomonas viridiflava]|uniref:hypothetical protein n=1 Tax=Pseudomonas viridiflava TaxID=33069 RepID=UPI00197C542B|nr:hypothetical protein [Pseudomonas viridiflava]
MAKIFLIKISDAYPESYWFRCNILTGQDPIILKKGKHLDEDLSIEFRVGSKSSVERILKYDFLFSDGPNFISPRFHQLLLDCNVTGVQFFDAKVYIGDAKYDGYKALNITSKSKAFDGSKSKSEPLLSYLPEGPKLYTEIVLKENIDPSGDIFRAEEDFTSMLAVARIKEICEANHICGLQFVEGIKA